MCVWHPAFVFNLFISPNLQISWRFCSNPTLSFDWLYTMQLKSIQAKCCNPQHTLHFLLDFLQSGWFWVESHWHTEHWVSYLSENALGIEMKQRWNQTGDCVTEWSLICTFVRETRAKNKTRPNTVSFGINSMRND